MKKMPLTLSLLLLLVPAFGYAAESVGRGLILESRTDVMDAYNDANSGYTGTLTIPTYDFYFQSGALRLDYFSGIDMAENSNDDTVAFQDALDFCRDHDLVLYIPEGTVDITDTISLRGLYQPKAWDTSDLGGTHVRTFNIVGAKYGESIIKLKNSSPGFTTSGAPKKMIVVWQPTKSDYATYYGNGSQNPDGTYKGPVQNTMITDENGEQNGSLYSFTLKNVTLDTGNNPGAIALKAVGAQNYLVSDVTIKGSNFFCGFYGLPGNAAVVRGLTIDGGEYGIVGSKDGSGWIGLASGNKKNTLFISTLLKNQSEAAIYFHGDNAAQASATFVGFEIYPPSPTATSPANAVKIDDTTLTCMNHLCLLDGYVKYPSGGSSTTAIDNAQSSVYINNVTFYNADTIMSGGPSIQTLSGDNNDTLVKEYAQVKQIGDPQRLPLVGGDRELIVKDSNMAIIVTEDVDPGASAPTDNFLTLHYNGRTAPHIDDPDYINVCDLDGDGIFYEVAENVSPNNFGGVREIQPTDQNGSNDNVIIQTILDSGAKVFLPKGVYYLGDGLELNENNTLFGVDNSYTLLTQSDSWNDVGSGGSSDYMIDTVSDADGKAYLADLYLLIDHPTSTAGKLGYVRWRQGKCSTISAINSTTYTMTNSDSTKHINEWNFPANSGGKVYGLDRVNSSPNANGIYSANIQGSENLHIYGFSIESDAGPNAQVRIKDSNQVFIYSAKAEEGTHGGIDDKLPNTIHIKSSNDIGIFSFGGKDVFEENGSKISFNSSNGVTFANITKNFNKVKVPGSDPAEYTSEEPQAYYLIHDQSGSESIQISQPYTTTNGVVNNSGGFKWPEAMIPLYKKGDLDRLALSDPSDPSSGLLGFPGVSYGGIENVYNILQYHNAKNAGSSECNLKDGSYLPEDEGSISMFIKCDDWSTGADDILNSTTMGGGNFIVIRKKFNNPSTDIHKLQVKIYENNLSIANEKLTVKDANVDLQDIWIHVVVTWQAGEQKIYFSYQDSSNQQVFCPVDGDGFTAATDPDWAQSDIQNVVLDGASNCDVCLRNLKIFPAVLNTDEIAELYANDNPDLWNGL